MRIIADFRLEMEFLAGDGFQSRRAGEQMGRQTILRIAVASLLTSASGRRSGSSASSKRAPVRLQVQAAWHDRDCPYAGGFRVFGDFANALIAVCVRIKCFVPLHNAHKPAS